MAGMYIIGSKIFNGIASGDDPVVACAVAGSVTVLPAVLELLGPKIDRGRIPFLPHLRTESSRLAVLAGGDRPRAAPARSCRARSRRRCSWRSRCRRFGMHVAKPSDESLSAQNEPALATLARVRAAFPGTSEPAFVVAAGPLEQRPTRRSASSSGCEKLVVARGIAHPPFTVSGGADGLGASLELPLTAAATTRRAAARSTSCATSSCPRRSAACRASRPP